jgi:hypothetical protein
MQNNQFQNLVYLLQAAENILFSFKVSNEITGKYETLRRKTFEKCGISYIPISFPQKEEKKTFENLGIQTETVENEHFTAYLAVNITITTSILEKISKINNFLLQMTEKPFNVTRSNVEIQTSPKVSAEDSNKSLLSSQIIQIESSLIPILKQLESLPAKLRTLNESLHSKTTEFHSTLQANQETFKRYEEDFQEILNSLKLSQKNERLKLVEQQTSLENIIELQEKQIEAQYREIHELKNIIQQKTEENESVKKVLQDEVIFANDEKFRIVDELKETLEKEEKTKKINFEKKLQNTLQENRKIQENLEKEKKILEEKVRNLEEKIVFERQKSREDDQNKEKQFFEHLEGLNLEIAEKNSVIRDLETRVSSVLFSKKEIFFEVSKIWMFFNTKELQASDDDEESHLVLKSLGLIKKLVEKLVVENNWLVDQLKIFEKSNKSSRSTLTSTLNSEISKESMKNSEVFHDFEKSRVDFKKYLKSRD